MPTAEYAFRAKVRKAFKEGKMPRANTPVNKAILAEMLLEHTSEASTELETVSRGKHLYIIECSAAPGLVKIGRSSDPARRAFELQTGQWFWVKVQAAFTDAGHLEKTVHHALRNKRATDCPGVEWFHVSFIEAVDAIVWAMDEPARSVARPARPGDTTNRPDAHDAETMDSEGTSD